MMNRADPEAPTETSPLLQDEGAARTEEDTYERNDGGSIEGQSSNGDVPKHQGMPEVKRRMKYIFPAIAVGVRLYHR
jgi:hypothetical protein